MIQTKQQPVFLTFDDGPHPAYTPEILRILKQFSATATFFVTGQKAKAYPNVMKHIRDNGHDIGNHTYTHPISPVFSPTRMEKEIRLTERIIKETTALTPTLFRPTWTTWDMYADRLDMIVRQCGYRSVRWTLSSLDWLGSRRLINYAMNTIHLDRREIILFHDGTEKALFSKRYATIDALPTFLEFLQDKKRVTAGLSQWQWHDATWVSPQPVFMRKRHHNVAFA